MISRPVADGQVRRGQALLVDLAHGTLQADVSLCPQKRRPRLELIDFRQAGAKLGNAELFAFQVNVGQKDEIEPIGLVDRRQFKIGLAGGNRLLYRMIEFICPIASRS